MRAGASNTATTREWRAARDADKFERMLEFGAALPRIRRKVAADLRRPVAAQPGREAVLATLVRLLDTTLVRVGNDEYARTNGSFGLTTLRRRHAAVAARALKLRFRGKSGVVHEVARRGPARRPDRAALPVDARTGTVSLRGRGRRASHGRLRRRQRLPAGGSRSVISPPRTSAPGTARVNALTLWAEQMVVDAANRLSANQVLAEVARRLGNTVAVCKKAYVHPRVLEVLAAGVQDAAAAGQARADAQAQRTHGVRTPVDGLPGRRGLKVRGIPGGSGQIRDSGAGSALHP